MKNGGLEVIKSNSFPEKKEEAGELEPENSIELHEKIIEHFPSENPNPVLRIKKNGKVLYANRAACILLEHWGIKKGEELPQSLRHGIRRILSQKKPENLEINIENATYALKLYPHSEDGYTDIYGFDISYRVRAEEKFRSQHERLEKLVELRTLEYIEANEKLAQEVTERKKIEKTLRNNLQFLETLLDSIPSPVFQRGLNENYVNCNESLARQIMGLPKEMGIGGSFSEFQKRVPKKLAEIYYKNDRELLDNGGSHYYETRVICADGVSRDFLFHKATYEDSSGEIAGIVGVMLDITPRKEAEKFLRKSEERYRIAAEQTGQLVYDYEVESKQIDWAGAIPQLTGYSPEEFRQVDLESWIEHVHPEDREKAWEIHEKCMKNGGKYLGEYRFRRKDGSYFHVEDSGVYIQEDLSQVYRIVGVIKDITERKLAREILERSEERFRITAEQTGQLVYDYNVKNNHSSWAGAVEELTGYSCEEFQGFTPEVWAQHVHPEDREKAVKAHDECIKNGGKYSEEYRFRRKDGSYICVEDSGIYLQADNRDICRVLGVIKDITDRKLAHEELVKSESRYRLIAEKTKMLLYYDNFTDGKIDWAGAIPQITGYSFEEFKDIRIDRWMELIHPEDLQKVRYAHECCLQHGGDFHQNYRFRRKDGSYFYVEDEGVYLKDEKGCVYMAAGVIKDITEKRAAQEKLLESEERFRIAAEQTGQIVFEHDHGGNIIKWAGAIRDVTGYTVDEFNKFDNVSWANHIHPEDREKTLGELRTFQEKENKFRIEYRFRKKDGSYIHVEDSGVYLRDENGSIRKAFGVMKDITGIKLASEKLKESEARYRSFMKNFRGIAFQMGLDFTPILVDGNIEETTGYRRGDFIFGKADWYRIVHPKDREKLFENRERLVKDPLLLIEHEYRIKHRDGKLRWIREIIQNVSDPTGKKRILQGTAYDISKQKEAEESLAKMEEIRKKEIHHRIKNNLQVISSLLELQAEKFNDIEVLEAFRESQNRVATMAIIHEELYRSKNNETLDFSAYLQKLTADLFHSYTVRKGDINIQLDIEETFLGMDTAIPLGIIINELVSNSLKHAFPSGRKGEVCIKIFRTEENSENKSISNSINNIGAKSSVEKNIQYTLVVSDNGSGFPENIDFRNTSSLGLQLVNILVEQLEGTIELEICSGTKFKIWFKETCQSSEKVSVSKGRYNEKGKNSGC
ncbi:PAS domain-containing protein [Methanosarcina sp. 2.H.A.1B.4]|uniref:PAS domain-containing protein n=1 Tax=Methanosarcina sp. 2.H.A.1B.4 TaxID=1483600 RepID=UPI00062233BA|nr:PAS domain-containing protein [Methanosarcina sp. 2.H.A.1B.4]KKG08512.1 histidine kinase [Methanosarcina sp. 2.H.A.1B.4]